ncbi:hypothetical protein GEMRC1_000785 [Eukaryota sp. GEM-RC1]
MLFDLVSTDNLTPNFQISPHFISKSLGLISFENEMTSQDLISLLKALQSNIPIKRVECLGFIGPTLKGLIALFQIIKFNKSLLGVDVFPHFIDVEREY